MPKDYRNYIGVSTSGPYEERKSLGGIANLFDKILDGAKFIATGGTILSPGDGYNYHYFTSPGNFEVVQGQNDIEYLVVGGGGGGAPGVNQGGGGGAGGFSNGTIINANIYGNYPITVGPGGSAITKGSPSFIGPPTSKIVESYGGGNYNPNTSLLNGGSGAAGGFGLNATTPAPVIGGFPNYVPGTVQGNHGGSPVRSSGGGGGGGVGSNEGPPGPAGNNGGDGGIGRALPNWDIPPSYGTPGPNPSLRYFAGGGGGGNNNGDSRPGSPTVGGDGGYGGGGDGGSGGVPPTGSGPSVTGYPTYRAATPGQANTGGGGGGGHTSWDLAPLRIGRPGGSGIVIIRYLDN